MVHRPTSGVVVGVVDQGIAQPIDYKEGETDVLNGIAYDAKGGRLFVRALA
jgi:glutamine cyclotransferase